jgi:prepilin peptidase CpaA
MLAEQHLMWAAVAVWAAVLSWKDCRTRRLPNAWTLGGAAAALVFRWGYGGFPLFLDGFAAAAVGGAFLLVPFLMRGAGGGDVKMLFAAGAVAGWGRLLPMLWVTSLAGVVMGLVMLAFGRLDGARLRHFARCAVDWRYDRAAGAAALPPKESARYRVPFSVPIAVGLIVALVW